MSFMVLAAKGLGKLSWTVIRSFAGRNTPLLNIDVLTRYTGNANELISV